MKSFRYLLIAILCGLPAADVSSEEKPNIIIIYADDMGYGDCTVNNPESKIPTPYIDRLAKEGLRFTDAHSPGATCTASRYGLLTGISPALRGVVNGINGLGPVLEAKELTIAEMLKAQGYSTRMVGKWHLGFELVAADGRRPVLDLSKPFVGGPLDHGFDTFLGMNSAMSSGPYYYIRNRGPEVLPAGSTKGTKTADRDRRESYAAGDLAPGFVHEEVNSRLCDEVIGIIRNHSADDDPEPLFLYYAMLEPHTPWLPEEQFAGKSGAGPYGNYVAQLDHEVGRVLQALKESGMENDTLVLFSSDNGALWTQANIKKYDHRANGPLAGGKARPQEGGHRVPFIARWPGRIPAGTKTDALINHTDMLATFAELLDVKDLDVETGIDSHSFLPVLREPDAPHQRPAMAVTERSFREGNWKLTFNRGRRRAGSDEPDVDQASLYNLADDLGETRDLSRTQPDKKKQLFAAYREYFAKRKLKPLAIQVAERKRNAKTQRESEPKRKKGTQRDSSNGQQSVKLNKEQQANVAALKKQFGQRRTELQKQLDKQSKVKYVTLLIDGEEGFSANLRPGKTGNIGFTTPYWRSSAKALRIRELLTPTKSEIVSISAVVPPEEYQSDADIVRYNDHFYIAFAKPIQEDENAFHVLQSVDGRDWKTAATLRSDSEKRRPDVRHSPHYSGRPVWFSIMPSGRLCVMSGAGSKAILWSTDDGNNWREERDFDLSRSYSRVLWQNNRAYCASDESSSCGERFQLFRVESADKGSARETTYKLAHDSHTLTGPREAQLAFTKDHAFCLLSFEKYNFDKVRRWLLESGSYATGRFGVSKAPYKEWTWMPTNLQFGHPNLLVLKDKRMISSVFIDGDNAHSALCQVDTSTGKMTELLRLPTGATRQPIGMTEHDGHIWACFYDGSQNRKDPPTLKVAKIKLGK